jgi:PilZ domain
MLHFVPPTNSRRESLYMFNFFNSVIGERRSAQRHELRIALRYRVRHSHAEHSAWAENVSEVGIFFETEEPMRVGTIVHLLLDMPELAAGCERAPWLCTGHVVRLDKRDDPQARTRQRVGVQFDCFEVLRGREFACASVS